MDSQTDDEVISINLFPKMIQKSLPIYIIIILSLSCCAPSPNGDSHNTSTQNKPMAHKLSPTAIVDSLQRSPYEIAKKVLGEPFHEEKFILGELQSEFRMGLNSHFTQEEIENNTVELLEASWKYDNNQNITIWYPAEDNQQAIEVYIWYNDAYF